jgi:hypothetical protein
MSKIRTVAIWVGALELIGLFFVVKGYRGRDHTQGVTIGDLFRPGAAIAPVSRGDALPPSAGDDTPPEDPDGRVVWFSRKYLERYASAERQMALAEGADAGLLPSEWPEAKYIADAAAYPGVEEYFLGYLRYIGKARDHYPVLMDSIATITIVESKMRPSDSSDVMKELSRALAAKREANLDMFNNSEAYGKAALQLHYFLASVGPRVSYDSSANAARFKVDAERQRTGVLLADLQNSAAKLGAASRLRKN